MKRQVQLAADLGLNPIGTYSCSSAVLLNFCCLKLARYVYHSCSREDEGMEASQ